MTVIVSDNVADITGGKDARPWKVWSPVVREGDDGVVSLRQRTVDVTDGVFTAELEPGLAVIESPDKVKWTVTVPDHDASLWDLIEVATGIPPSTPEEVLYAAVRAWLADNPTIRDLIGAVSDFDFRLDDTRTPTDGSVSVDKLTDDLAAAVELLSGFDPSILRLGLAPDLETGATQVEVYTGADDPPSRRARWDSSGSFRQFGAIWQGLDDSEGTNYFLNGAAGTFRGFQFLSAGLPRWIFGVSVDAESGGDVGSKFQIRSRHDDGSDKTIVVSINRATDVVTLAGELVTLASSTTRAGLNVPPGSAPTDPVNGDVWTTTAGLFARINGATAQFIAAADVAAAATASKIAQRDSNANLSADAFIPSVTSTATAAGTTTLTIADTAVQVFTGTSTQTVKLPTTSVTAGMMYIVSNQSSGTVTVQSSGASTVCDVRAGRVGIFVAQKDTPTAAADWWPFVPTTSSVASTIAQRDSNGNLLADGFIVSADSTATAAGTTTLTITNSLVQEFTGSTTQTVKLPTTSVAAGQQYTVCNNSSGTVTVQSSGANTIDTVAAGTLKLFVAQKATPTAAADWRAI